MKIISDDFASRLIQLLNEPRQTVIIAHQYPDGDAMGAALGLSAYLKKKKCETTVIAPTNYPDFLKWLPGSEQVIRCDNNTEVVEAKLQTAELIFCVDFNELGRMGKAIEGLFPKLNSTKILIDHHPSPASEYFDLVYSDSSASSTAEVIWEFIKMMTDRELMDEQIAECLLTGIIADTGSFAYNTGTAQTFKTVASLLDYGVSQERIKNKLYNAYSADRMRLMGYCLKEKMTLYSAFHTASIHLDSNEIRSYNYKIGDSEGLVNLPLSIKEVIFSAYFMEQEDYIKLSFRSHGSFDVNRLAREHFNGGGHSNAAGGRYYGPMTEALKHFEQCLEQYQTELENAYQELQ